ncbi:hypothetical protein [Bacillus sp. PS06]|uniref:hypothetical protein n=1 Tax=Bacillus sp. PS06 TaxID=2764176 RepID=UPI0017823F45|nr:hypothetical protein [Bacillus sp. PS06]MBD8070425.1 hypothetical protein [Bacillus sp. PS06]
MLSKAASTIFTVLFLLFIFGMTAYLETTFISDEDTSGILTNFSAADEVQETLSEEQSEEEEVTEILIPTLEDRLVNTELIDGYIVEEYREFEVYTDEEGNVVKTVPTANYNYIRYMNN